jgi:hypothetical protein
MIGICIAHIGTHGADSSIVVVLAVVAGVSLVLLSLAIVQRTARGASEMKVKEARSSHIGAESVAQGSTRRRSPFKSAPHTV